MKVKVLVPQQCQPLCNPMDCSHSLLQGILPTQELKVGLLHCRQTLYHLSHHGSPMKTMPFP